MGFSSILQPQTIRPLPAAVFTSRESTSLACGRFLSTELLSYESNGILHDMWEAMANLHRKRPDFIQSLAWFSFDDGFSFSPDYKLISLSPFEKNENVDSRARRFTYLEPPKPAARGFLVARLILEDGPIDIIELQRKPKLIKNKDGKVKNGEDPFQGMVFRLEKETQLIPWLQLFQSQIRYAFGVVRRLTGECPGEAKSFSHRAPGTLKTDCLPCESLVLHALGKIKRRF